MTVAVRFAPSPTGRLHVGNVRPALINWLFARREGGRFLLRFDDTDRQRCREDYVTAIRDDLRWLGLTWDGELRQSARSALYDAAAARLKAAGRLYPCYETAGELDLRRKRQLARGLPPVYDRAALRLTAAERQRLEAQGRRPHWRFLLETGAVAWDDLIRGPQRIAAESLSDPVLVRADGSFLYTLPSVVDDIDCAITHVIRGEDHVANTGVQIQLFEALGAEAPRFAHHNLLVDADGGALSKRLGSLAIGAFRDEGLEPLAVVSHAATIGSAEPVAPHGSLDELAALFDFAKLSRAPARFDVTELRSLNARLLHMLPYEAVAERLAAMAVGGGAGFWQVVRGNVAVLSEARDWWRVVTGPLDPIIEDAQFCATARDLLPAEPWTAESWGRWTEAVRQATGARGRALFQPLRLALTGRDHGPELKALLPLIGRDKAAARLGGQSA